MEVKVYINELSLNGQFCGTEAEAVKKMMTCYEHLKSLIDGTVSLCYKEGMWQKELCSGSHAKLSALATFDTDLSVRFKLMLDRGEKIQVADRSSNYSVGGRNVGGSALSAAADNMDKGEPTVVFSFPDSYYSGNKLKVKYADGEQELQNITYDDQTEDVAATFEVREKYDRSKRSYVPDQLTILADTSLFTLRPDIQRQQGRRVYERLDKKQYWYVDNFHKNGDAHLEVFDKNGNHIGTCDIDNIELVDTTKKDKNKSIDV